MSPDRINDPLGQPSTPEIAWPAVAAAFCERATDGKHTDEIAALLAEVLPRFAEPALLRKYFRLFEEHGVHVTPVHFFQPIPDMRTLGDELWTKMSELPGIDLNEAGQLRLLRDAFPRFRQEYEQLPLVPTEPGRFYLNNGAFEGTDALALYCMIRHFRPSLILEVGSGFSSLLAAEAALKNGQTKLVCIEPYPSEFLKAGFPGLTSLITEKVQEVELSVFEQLGPNDVLFIDSSHVVKIGGDVNYLFLEVLPRLKPGVVVHVHDIFLPGEYHRGWILDNGWFWTEQYLLQAFLAFNSAFEILLANSYLGRKHIEELRRTFPSAPGHHAGGSFWMRRKSE